MTVQTYTVQNVEDRARRYAGMENSEFISAAESLDLLNMAYAELYDILVSANENYFVSTSTITMVSGTEEYNLPSDFYKAIGVDWQVSSNQYVTLRPYLESERNSWGVTGNLPPGNLRLRYVPKPTLYSTSSDTIDTPDWTDFLAIHMAVSMLEKEESSTTALERRLEKIRRRVMEMADNRDMGMPARVGDVNVLNRFNRYTQVRYRFYGNTIHVLSSEYVSAVFM